MKSFIITAAAALVAISASPGVLAAKSVRVQVNGMVCAFCAAAIEKKLSAMPETKSVYVNLEKKIVAMELKDGKTANLDKVRAEVKDAGYDVVSIGETDQTLAQIKAGLK